MSLSRRLEDNGPALPGKSGKLLAHPAENTGYADLLEETRENNDGRWRRVLDGPGH
jgi:hypothetical protein